MRYQVSTQWDPPQHGAASASARPPRQLSNFTPRMERQTAPRQSAGAPESAAVPRSRAFARHRESPSSAARTQRHARVAKMLGRHGKSGDPVEWPFTSRARLSGLLAKRTTKSPFLRRHARFWWRGFQRGACGDHRFVPRERYEPRAARVRLPVRDPAREGLPRPLLDLLWPFEDDEGVSGIVEQSCDSGHRPRPCWSCSRRRASSTSSATAGMPPPRA